MGRVIFLVPMLLGVGLATAAIGQDQPAPAATPAKPTPPPVSRGEDLFVHRCMDCHDPPAGEATPDRGLISQYPAQDLVDVMETGRMAAMSTGLSHQDVVAIALWLTTPPPEAAKPPAPPEPAEPAPKAVPKAVPKAAPKGRSTAAPKGPR